jgi:hypothetical protein
MKLGTPIAVCAVRLHYGFGFSSCDVWVTLYLLGLYYYHIGSNKEKNYNFKIQDAVRPALVPFIIVLASPRHLTRYLCV